MVQKSYRQGSPSNKNERLYCDLHDINGHNIVDCRYLKEFIECLIRRDHLTKWVAQEGKKYREEKIV